jgi:hypothetical protein
VPSKRFINSPEQVSGGAPERTESERGAVLCDDCGEYKYECRCPAPSQSEKVSLEEQANCKICAQPASTDARELARQFRNKLINGEIIKESDGEPWSLTKSEATQVAAALETLLNFYGLSQRQAGEQVGRVKLIDEIAEGFSHGTLTPELERKVERERALARLEEAKWLATRDWDCLVLTEDKGIIETFFKQRIAELELAAKGSVTP